ncbi:MAG TPA: TetR/AcrR family transcriptional regulator [Galbitalea sp.]|jgi:AcrR family transcriptional regulator|nr:TetR/AcrR family transcriptional regulator [Galbitalea sp.]
MEAIDGRLGAAATLRNEPVQARSTARLTALLDAAAAAIDELGYERLTTAMVAERAGASIGTVYRYFPDRIAVLQALAARNLDRILTSLRGAVADRSNKTWRDAAVAGFDRYVDAFRSEPGFASLRGGDVIDLRPASAPRTVNSHIAEVLMTELAARFGTTASVESQFAFENAVEVMDALVARAVARSKHGDTAFLDSGRALVLSILGERLG